MLLDRVGVLQGGSQGSLPWLESSFKHFHIRVHDYAGCFYVHLTPSRVVLKEGTPVEKMSPPDWPMGKRRCHPGLLWPKKAG